MIRVYSHDGGRITAVSCNGSKCQVLVYDHNNNLIVNMTGPGREPCNHTIPPGSFVSVDVIGMTPYGHGTVKLHGSGICGYAELIL